MLETVFDHGVIYYLWLLTLTLAFAQSIILINLYLKSKGTPIGRLAFYTSLSSLMWSAATVVFAVRSIQEAEVFVGVFLFITTIAGIAATLAAYERARIQGILTPTGEREIKGCRLCRFLGVLVLIIAFVEIILFILNVPSLNAGIEGFSAISAISFIFISGSLIALTMPKFPNRIVYVGCGFAVIAASIVLLGHLVEFFPLHQ